jgi:hypothetical protein
MPFYYLVIKVNDLAQLHDLLPLSCCWHSAAVTVTMLLMSTKSDWSWSRITWDSSGEFGSGSDGS